MGAIGDDDARRLKLTAAARELHTQTTVVDLHVDSLLQQRLFGYNVAIEHTSASPIRWRSLKYDLFKRIAQLSGHHRPFFNHADIPRMRRGGYSAVGFGLHMWPWQSERGWHEINKQLDYFEHLVQNTDHLVKASTPSDVRRAAANGQIAAFCGFRRDSRARSCRKNHRDTTPRPHRAPFQSRRAIHHDLPLLPYRRSHPRLWADEQSTRSLDRLWQARCPPNERTGDDCRRGTR